MESITNHKTKWKILLIRSHKKHKFYLIFQIQKKEVLKEGTNGGETKIMESEMTE